MLLTPIFVEALVDTDSEKIIFVESAGHFIDALLGYLATPTKKFQFFSTFTLTSCILVSSCWPQSQDSQIRYSHSWYQYTYSTTDDTDVTKYFLCSRNCNLSETFRDLFFERLFFKTTGPHFRKIPHSDYCDCGAAMKPVENLLVDDDESVFVKEKVGLIITDDLQVFPSMIGPSSPLFTKLGTMFGKCRTERRCFRVGREEILKLIRCSFVSKTPLTDVLLTKKQVPAVSHCFDIQEKFIGSQSVADAMNLLGEISIKLIICKTKKVFCYAEAGQDFVDLLYRFRVVSPGFIANRMHHASFGGCIDQLYRSIRDLDDQYMKSNLHREMLLSPKLDYTVETPSSQYANVKYVITDDLRIRRDNESPVFVFSLMANLMVPLNDFEEQVVQVGKDEIFRLLMNFFFCDSALTKTFMRKPKEEPK